MNVKHRATRALVSLMLLAPGCSSVGIDAEPFDFRIPPFDLRAGDVGCVFQAGEEYPRDFNNFGPLRDNESERRSDGDTAQDIDYEISTRVQGGTLSISVNQPSVGVQAVSYDLADIPEEGIIFEGPWGGPYDEFEGSSPDTYRMTCWTG